MDKLKNLLKAWGSGLNENQSVPKFSIQLFRTGECRVDGEHSFRNIERDRDHIFTIYIAVLQGGGKNILVDTGMVSVDEMNRMAGFLMTQLITQEEGEDTLSILARAGLDPNDIDYIFLTHCHYDHCSNTVLFPSARVVIPAKAWDVWHTKPDGAIYLHEGFLGYLEELHRDDRLILVDEGWVVPGIGVRRVGGHSVCSQFVYANTSRGLALFGGDTVQMYTNLEKNDIIAICENEAECWHALELARTSADILIPGHDPRVLSLYPGGLVA